MALGGFFVMAWPFYETLRGSSTRPWIRMTYSPRLNSELDLYCQPLISQGPTIRLKIYNSMKRIKFRLKWVLNRIDSGGSGAAALLQRTAEN